jgi:hypothetical protein
MADQRISVHDRVKVLDQVNGAAWWLNKLASWLGSRGVETEADMIDQAARDLLAACWLLERPLRLKPPPERWHDGGTGLGVPYQQAPDQRQ